MRPSLVEGLRALREDVGADVAGRLLQRLLALALVRSGWTVEEEQTCEGPDIVALPYQIEAKTTDREPFEIREKDLADIADARARGRAPLLAFLALDSFEGWILARADGWREKTIYRRDLALRRERDLEARADEHFDAVVEAWLPALRRDWQAAFQEMDACRKRGAWTPGTSSRSH